MGEFNMNLKSFKCKKCGMIFLNSRELDVHEINVHIDKLYQCKSCYKILWNADEFNEHIKKIHYTSIPSLLSSSFESGSSIASNKIQLMMHKKKGWN